MFDVQCKFFDVTIDGERTAKDCVDLCWWMWGSRIPHGFKAVKKTALPGRLRVERIGKPALSPCNCKTAAFSTTDVVCTGSP